MEYVVCVSKSNSSQKVGKGNHWILYSTATHSTKPCTFKSCSNQLNCSLINSTPYWVKKYTSVEKITKWALPTSQLLIHAQDITIIAVYFIPYGHEIQAWNIFHEIHMHMVRNSKQLFVVQVSNKFYTQICCQIYAYISTLTKFLRI